MLTAVADILIASDDPALVRDIEAALGGPDATLRVVTSGPQVLPEVRSDPPDLVILDLQIGNMGGMATSMNLRLETSGGRIAHVPVLMLLDRRPDVFLARRSGAEGWLIKPVDPIRLRRAGRALLEGGEYHDLTAAPVPIVSRPA
jgi:DNA-binding response OmpR family regulator